MPHDPSDPAQTGTEDDGIGRTLQAHSGVESIRQPGNSIGRQP